MHAALKLIQEIPRGKVTTYKILADKLNSHPRGIAMAMKCNKDPVNYPCYKVVAHDRTLGGYSGPGGIATKIALLQSDGIPLIDGKILEENIHFF